MIARFAFDPGELKDPDEMGKDFMGQEVHPVKQKKPS